MKITENVVLLPLNVGEVAIIRDGKPDVIDLSVDAVRSERYMEEWDDEEDDE